MKRQYSILIIGYALFMCGVSVYRGVRQFPDVTSYTAWYEQIIEAVFFAILAIATIVYEVRRTFRANPAQVRAITWRNRIELRTVLYALAALLILVLPNSIFKSVRAASGQYPSRFWEEFQFTESLLYPAIGVWLILYDRKRIWREQMNDPATA